VLAGCGGGAPVLDLTLDVDPAVSDGDLAKVTELKFTAAGDESGTFDLPLSRPLARTERLLYRPRSDSRAISLAVDGFDTKGVETLHGGSVAIALGSTSHAEITLYGTTMLGDAGALDGGVDQATPGGGLVGWWKLDEGSGTTASDSSGNGNTGLLSGGPKWTTGIAGDALDFSGSSMVVVHDAADLSGMAAVTVATWIKLAALSDGDFVSKRHAGPPYFSYDLQVHSDGTVGFEATTESGGGGSAGSSTKLPTGAWHHVAGVYDGVTVRVYIDGVADGYTNELSGAVSTTTDSLVMNFSGFSGALDDVRVYARALAPAEIAALHENP